MSYSSVGRQRRKEGVEKKDWVGRETSKTQREWEHTNQIPAEPLGGDGNVWFSANSLEASIKTYFVFISWGESQGSLVL